jgi:hypothetical protein
MRLAIAVIRLRALCIALCAALPACATQVIDMKWIRADGKPVVEAEFEAARVACSDEVRKAGASSKGPVPPDVFRVCMLQRGYVQEISQ